MPNTQFRFKKFTINQNLCAMKVGTDAVLLGSWCNENNANSILDIGTGTGVLALMMAQKNINAKITGIDVDSLAISQAIDNFKLSIYHHQISIKNISVQVFSKFETSKFDLIISNPPYFENSSKANTLTRTLARHNDSLSYEDLFESVGKLLTSDGKFYAIYPYNEMERILEIAQIHNLNIQNKLIIFTKATKTPKRVIMHFSFNSAKSNSSSLIIQNEIRHDYTEDYKNLTKDFYINF